MPAAHILAADQINADTAGHTGEVEPNPGAPAPPTPGEVLHGEINLGSLFSGGVHPEHVAAVIDRGLERATDSVRGKLGGLKPVVGSVLQPGPAGGTNAARAILGGWGQRVVDAFKR